MTRDADLELIEEAARSRVLEKLWRQHPSIPVATEAIAVTGWTVLAWAWWDDGRAHVVVERMHFIDAARWRDQVAQLARLDERCAS